MGFGEQGVTVIPERKNKSSKKKWIFIAFILIVGLLLFFAFFENPITGSVVDFKKINASENVKINAKIGDIQVPIETKQQINEIYIEVVGVGNKINVGKEGVLDLSDLGIAKIKLEDFDGSISFDADKIFKLKGEVSKVTVNDFPTTSTDGSIDISLDRELSYRYIELNEFYLEKYETLKETGTVKFEGSKVTIQLEDDPLLIEDFIGILKSGAKSVSGSGIRGEGLTLEGSVRNVKMGNEFQLNLFK